ncbi:uncharacterized protein cubi_00485 [Cryptosporidium ubiquitum]|uniref:Uncharacterized protein n=1 Tax=Cryptosporidium ubiquitum TaxID=857276 RepID=A0A1J4ME20_9CRYT|nr:uncharacterized protein cubi_00485 [Cryptosporidium ubiquitum]OII72490.1 hypothetical protein cubi_00485 [Cryptosporidium ubiquitum]
MFKIYIILHFIFIYIQTAYSSHSNSGDGTSSSKYFILDPIKYNNFVQSLMETPEEVISGNNFRSSDNFNLIKMNKLQDIICKESDLVFSNTETDVNYSTVLNLNTGDNEMKRNKNYLLLFGADKCILDSSFIDRKSIKINIRVIPDLRSPTKEVYYDKICDCLFKREISDESGQNVFEVHCNSDLSIDIQQNHDYLEIGGVDTLNETDLVKFPTLVAEKNSEVGKKVEVVGSETFSIRAPNIKSNHVKTIKPKVNEFNFSKYFWETSSGFFGEGQEAENKANIEYCKSQNQNKSCENEKRLNLEKEFRESCSSKEHQLILDTLLIIVDKLVEHLDNK